MMTNMSSIVKSSLYELLTTLRTVLLSVVPWRVVRGGEETAFRTENKRFVGTKRTS